LGWAQVRPRAEEIAPNLVLLQPWPLLPGACSVETANHVNATFTARQIASFLGESAGPFLLWLATPWAAALIPELRPARTCYDCMDLIPAFYRGHTRTLVEKLEATVLRGSDFVFASSQILFDRCRAVNNNVHLVRNGVWVEQYQFRSEVPVDLRPLPRPLLGYVGTIGPWMEWSLLAALANAFPQASVVLIGPMHDPARLRGLPVNVHWLGSKPQAEVASYIAAFDVCLIPFVQDELSAAVNPVKFYEHCAAGRPTVSVPLPELQAHAQLCYLGGTADEFVAATRLALAEAADQEHQQAAVKARRQLAAENSWSAQGQRIRRVLEAAVPPQAAWQAEAPCRL
jgi:hypothetical protein